MQILPSRLHRPR